MVTKKEKKKVNPNILPNGDNQLMFYFNGKFQAVSSQQIITSKEHRNFLITCEYGDWSPFLTWKEVEERITIIERDYLPGMKPNFFFKVVERL